MAPSRLPCGHPYTHRFSRIKGHYRLIITHRRRQCQDYFPLFPSVNSSFGNNENSAKARKCAWAVRSHYNRVSLYFDQWVLAFLLHKSGTLALNHSSCSPCLQIKSLMLYKLPVIIIMSHLPCAGGPYNAMFFSVSDTSCNFGIPHTRNMWSHLQCIEGQVSEGKKKAKV